MCVTEKVLIQIKTFSIFAACNPGNFYRIAVVYYINFNIMKFSLFLSIFTFLSISIFAQDDNHRVIDEKSGKEILLGTVTRDGLKTMGNWFDSTYMAYEPNAALISSIKAHSSNYPWVFIVMGTWCSDSREQVPHFLKILDQLDYPTEQIFMVAVDRDKKAGNFCVGDYGIKLVPTFIFTVDGDETGRIVETPLINLEQDFLNILIGKTASSDNK